MSACLADHGKHHWSYRQDSTPRVRECQKCGVVQQRQPNGRYVQTGSTRWKPS
jgi:hypothetical protein